MKISYPSWCVEKEILREFARYREETAISGTLTVVVGFSGGLDSRALLHALWRLRDRLEICLIAAHIDHGLREKSADEADFARKVCETYDIPLFSTRLLDTSDKRGNIEAWGREERYKFFDTLRDRYRPSVLVTAHHLGDQVETFLFRLLSNRLVNDSRAILARSFTARCLRPLLRTSRQEIASYALAHKIEFIHDDSNWDLRRTRNRIRHQLLPALKRDFNPEIAHGIAELATRLKEDEDFLDNMSKALVKGIIQEDKVNLREIMSQHPSLQWRTVRDFFVEVFGLAVRPPSYRAINACLDVLRDDDLSSKRIFNRKRRFEMNNGYLLFVSGDGTLFWVERSDADGAQLGNGFDRNSWELSIPGKTTIEILGVGKVDFFTRIIDRYVKDDTCRDLLKEESPEFESLREELPDESLAHFTNESHLNCIRLNLPEFNAEPLLVKQRSGGEHVVIAGKNRSLKKVFQDKHVPIFARSVLPLIFYGNELVWVPGVVRSSDVVSEVDSSSGSTIVELWCSENLLRISRDMKV